MLGLFFATIAVFAGLTLLMSDFNADSGSFLYGAVAFIVMTMGLLVAPALSSTSVNGDRAAGTLATLQLTLLSPAEIVTGKLLAAWFTALVFLATGVPFLLLAMVPGGTSPARFVVTVVLMSVMLLTMCAIALGWSAVTARTVSSVVMTYLTLAFLCLGTLILFGVSLPLVETTQRVQVLANPPDVDYSSTPIPRSECVVIEDVRTVYHTEAIAWLLAANPYVVVADAAPGKATDDVFTWIKYGVRTAFAGAEEPRDECWAARANQSGAMDEQIPPGLVWPFGLVINLLLAAGSLVFAVRRLTLPVAQLPRGTRIA